MIVIDTSVLSLALRRRNPGPRESSIAARLRDVVTSEQDVAIPGIVLQEILTGVKASVDFERLCRLLDPYPVLTATRERHVEAARISNRCRSAGVTAPTADCLIAAQTIAARGLLLTTDTDFADMAPHCDLRLLRA